jgi:hypothetical protein
MARSRTEASSTARRKAFRSGSSFVVLLTGLASALGAQLTGLLAPFPLYGTILMVFAHAQQGPTAAQGVVRGLLYGLFGFAGFFLMLALPRQCAPLTAVQEVSYTNSLSMTHGAFTHLSLGKRVRGRNDT